MERVEFVKTGATATLTLERLKTEAARACCAHGVEFYVPKPLGLSEQGALSFERVEGFLTTEQCLLRGFARPRDMGKALGRGLAMVHRQMRLPQCEDRRCEQLWGTEADENVFFHGDFTKLNTGFVPPRMRPIFVDWSLAPALPERTVTHGSRYFDCALFIFDAWFSISDGLRDRLTCGSLAQGLLDGYREVTPISEGTLVRRAQQWQGIFHDIFISGMSFYLSKASPLAIYRAVQLVPRWHSWRRVLQRACELGSLSEAMAKV